MPRIAQETNCICCARSFNARVIRSDVSHLCVPCFDEAGEENAHQDGHHDLNVDGQMDVSNANCHICNETDPHAGFRSRPASGNQGKVMSDTDGRLVANTPSLPADAERVRLTGKRLGVPNAKYVGEASVIKRDTHTWGGHSSWVLVIVDGVTQRRWFWSEDVEDASTPPRRNRGRRSAAAA